MHWNDDWHSGWMSPWWLLIMAVVAFGVWFGVSKARRRRHGDHAPERILKERYANGEMSREAYGRKLAELRK